MTHRYKRMVTRTSFNKFISTMFEGQKYASQRNNYFIQQKIILGYNQNVSQAALLKRRHI